MQIMGRGHDFVAKHETIDAINNVLRVVLAGGIFEWSLFMIVHYALYPDSIGIILLFIR